MKNFVDFRLEDGASAERISREVKKKFGANISLWIIRRYRRKRWIPYRKQVETADAALEGTLRRMRAHPEREVREAVIYELIRSLKPEALIRKMTPALLHRRDVEDKRLDTEKEKLAIENKRVENQGKALRAKLREANGSRGRGENRKAVGDEKADPAEIRRRIREIYGLSDDRSPGAPDPIGTGCPGQSGAAAGPTKSGPAPALPGEVAPR